jgi:hypothetical protein
MVRHIRDLLQQVAFGYRPDVVLAGVWAHRSALAASGYTAEDLRPLDEYEAYLIAWRPE